MYKRNLIIGLTLGYCARILRYMRMTEFMAVVNGEASSDDERISHLEQLPKTKWKKKYLAVQTHRRKEWQLFDN